MKSFTFCGIIISVFVCIAFGQQPFIATINYAYDSVMPYNQVFGHKVVVKLSNQSPNSYFVPWLKPMYWRIKIFRYQSDQNKYIQDAILERQMNTAFLDTIPYYLTLREYQKSHPVQFVYSCNEDTYAITELNGNTSQQSFVQSILNNTDTSYINRYNSYYESLADYLTGTLYIDSQDSVSYSYSLFFLWHKSHDSMHIYNDKYKILFEYNSEEIVHPIMMSATPSLWNGYQKFQGVIRSDTLNLEIVNNQVHWNILQ